jgi:ubiquinone/menaquinone biosynthesis C-methylase UbiE
MRFNDPAYAEFYNRRQIDSGYPGRLLDIVTEHTAACTTILDIGSGTGFFTIPLAEKGRRVTAVEPSRPMTEQMMQDSPPELKNRINIHNVTWEKWEGGEHDCAICIHSLYPMADPLEALEKMIRYSGKRIVIVRDPSGMKTLSGIVRETVCTESGSDLNPLIQEYLIKKDIHYNKTAVSETREYRFKDAAIETESILYQLRLGKEYFQQVLNIIEKNTLINDRGRLFNSFFCDNVWIF